MWPFGLAGGHLRHHLTSYRIGDLFSTSRNHFAAEALYCLGYRFQRWVQLEVLDDPLFLPGEVSTEYFADVGLTIGRNLQPSTLQTFAIQLDEKRIAELRSEEGDPRLSETEVVEEPLSSLTLFSTETGMVNHSGAGKTSGR